MQTCPNCGSETRTGAKFCTSCGYRFAENGGSEAWAEAVPQTEDVAGRGEAEGGAEDSVHREGWPSAPTSAESPAAAWDTSAPGEPAPEPGSLPPTDADASGFWPEASAVAWPSTPTAATWGANEGNASLAQPGEAHIQRQAESGGQQGAQATALDLLERLRAVIESTEPTDSRDLTGVIADLEVAATPPGAIPQDDLAELRDALFAAREKPRDVDTIVDLTKRIDGLVSLVVAYDRAIAAIERSLDALRDERDG